MIASQLEQLSLIQENLSSVIKNLCELIDDEDNLASIEKRSSVNSVNNSNGMTEREVGVAELEDIRIALESVAMDITAIDVLHEIDVAKMSNMSSSKK